MAEIEQNTQNTQENFRRKPVCEFIDGKHHFEIPSYQRGYRWETKQVLDLLEDIKQFVLSDNHKVNEYYLQPLVVKPNGISETDCETIWEVLDGQQRLTTIRLILLHLRQEMRMGELNRFGNAIYDIRYKSRPQLDFEHPVASSNIDSYYLAEAKRTIEKWFSEQTSYDVYTPFIQCLFYPDNKKKVYFIWYAIDPETIDAKSDETDGADNESEDIKSIRVFNRLNKGKIGLTSSELIKALFVMDNELNREDESPANYSLKSEQLTMEWNEMERRFQDDRFWLFISNSSSHVQTRIDVLFDFLTRRPSKVETDLDYSYRKFQNLYDYCHGTNVELDALWRDLNITTMEKAWLEIIKTYNLLEEWFDGEETYHYIGYLVDCGMTPLEIYNTLQDAKQQAKAIDNNKEWTEEDTTKEFYRMIMNFFRPDQYHYYTKEDIDSFEYGQPFVRRLLLLFNVESYRRNASVRFDFRLYKKEHWDIEHIDSQNTATVQDIADRARWIEHVRTVLLREDKLGTINKVTSELICECDKMISDYKQKGRFSGRKSFEQLFERVNKYFAFDPTTDKDVDSVNLAQKEKDSISNLTLLDSATNREYQDAPFPSKRACIVKYDREGHRFIPMCTRNVFLKYYSDTTKEASYLDGMRWTIADKSSYLAAIHNMVDHIFDTVTDKENDNANE